MGMTALLVLHGLCAVVLLGAITHQAFAVGRSAPRENLASAFRAVDGTLYRTAVVILFIVVCIGGALLYPRYRLVVRPVLADLDLRSANGAFEIKEHLSALGLMLLPVYWASWTSPVNMEHAATRRGVTWLLMLIVWWNFLVGSVLNDIKGMFG